jgi:hypothetical protein
MRLEITRPRFGSLNRKRAAAGAANPAANGCDERVPSHPETATNIVWTTLKIQPETVPET